MQLGCDFLFSLFFFDYVNICNPSGFTLLRVNDGLRLLGIKQILFNTKYWKWHMSISWRPNFETVFSFQMIYFLTYHSLKQVGFQCTKSRNIHQKKHTLFWPRFFNHNFSTKCQLSNSSTNLRKIKKKSLKRRVFFKFKLDKYQPCAAPTGADTRLLRRLSFSLY